MTPEGVRDGVDAEDAAVSFDPLRPLLTRVAYRMLGSVADAEDVVQDAFIRWLGTDRGAVRESAAFLRRTVTRLCLDQLKSARVQRHREGDREIEEFLHAMRQKQQSRDDAQQRIGLFAETTQKLHDHSPPSRKDGGCYDKPATFQSVIARSDGTRQSTTVQGCCWFFRRARDDAKMDQAENF